MPRQARIKSETGFYHIMARGVGKQILFEDDKDKNKFLNIIERGKEKYDYNIFAYCLMDNHIHLLLEDVNMQLSEIMRIILQMYSYYYNSKYDRTGHVFQERFRSEPILNDRQFMNVISYIVQNPAKAGICSYEDYKWSSFGAYSRKDRIVSVDFVLDVFGGYDELKSFIGTDGGYDFIDVDSNDRLTDAKAIIIAKEKCNISNIITVQSLERKKRNEILKALHEEGLAIRQISRLTGICLAVVQRAIK